MTEAPALRTERLAIVPFAERHLTEQYVGWLNDKSLMRYSEQRNRRHTLESCRAYWQSFQGTANHFWAIEEIKEGLGHIGNINAYVNEPNALADVGLMIGRSDLQGRGYGLESWRAVCDFLFHRGGIRKISAGALETNESMLKIMRRVGMVNDGRRYKHYLVDGVPVDIVHMAVFRTDWPQDR